MHTHIYIHTCLQIYLHTDMRAYRHNFTQATLLGIKSGINTLNSSTYSFSEKWALPRCAHINKINNINFMVSVRVYMSIYNDKHIWYLYTYVKTIQTSTCWLTYRHIPNKINFGWWGWLQCCKHGIRFWYINKNKNIYCTYKSEIKNNINKESWTSFHMFDPMSTPLTLISHFLARWTVDTFSPEKITVPSWAENLQTYLFCSLRTFPTPLHHFFQFLLSTKNEIWRWVKTTSQM